MLWLAGPSEHVAVTHVAWRALRCSPTDQQTRVWIWRRWPGSIQILLPGGQQQLDRPDYPRQRTLHQFDASTCTTCCVCTDYGVSVH